MFLTNTVSPQFVAEVLNTAHRLGFDNQTQQIINVNELGKLSRVPVGDFCRYLIQLERFTGDENIGLRLGEQLEPSCFNLMGHLVMSCSTIGAAMPLVNKFQRLVIDYASSEYWEDDQGCHFTWTSKHPTIAGEKILIDLVLSSVRSFGVWATGVKEAFSTVNFQCSSPIDTSTCYRIFGHHGNYGCAVNGFSYPLAWREHAIKSANALLQPMIYDQAKRSLRNLRNECPFVAKLIDVLTKLLPRGGSSIERVAIDMNVSPRTLQRQLKQLNTSYREVLKKVRHSRAIYLLNNSRLSLAEISESLGYREQSSFSNAYKSWVGKSPIAERQPNDGKGE